MKVYTCRVRLHNGTFADMPFTAISLGQAIAIIESQFGAGSFLGCITEDYV